ncbi:hypothetical protein [Glutamicibacter sp. V16R2B1]|uniref:hypothetical protein n=1 Tax=Glutamicibacter sp. V16R2B1 TaxID=2036207 RepID=UPI0010FCF4CD|nr:hypothetical protein [Glutamicibacter sp. V16R2B1]MCK9901317.1 hypothetical protein [Frankia sp. Cpl3]TLK46874.1 hypothetical protein FDN03_16125 [Glutamicibacter sp. V16R2B1]
MTSSTHEKALAANGALWAAGYHLLELISQEQEAHTVYLQAAQSGGPEVDPAWDAYTDAYTARVGQLATVELLARHLDGAETVAISALPVHNPGQVAA